jgi:hypothetical protein
MSNEEVTVNRIAFWAIAASGLLNACGQTSKNHSGDSGTGGSNAAGLHGGAAPASGASTGNAAPSGGRSTANGGTASGSSAAGAAEVSGGAQAAGGAVATSGGVAHGGEAGEAGASGAGGEAGAAGSAGESGVGSGTAAPAYFQAGTRLKPRVLRGGGLEVLASGESGWFDVQLGEWCSFRLGADGVERCFPGQIGSNTYYLDANCTKPALVGSNLQCDDAELTPYHYFTLIPVDATSLCGGTTYRLGTPRTGGVQVYSNAADSCEPVSDPGTVWPLEKVPPETFVAVQRVSQPRLPNMNAWVREGADGSSEVVGFYDPVRKTPCFGLGLDEPTNVCVPSAVDVQDTFADASCTQRVGFDNPFVCRAPTSTAFLELGTLDDGCTATKSILGLWQIAGTRRTPVYYYSTIDQSCERQSPPELRTAYLQGPSIDPASLPKLDVIHVGKGPLRMPFYGFDGVPFLPATDSFVEAASGDACYARLFGDGTWRCVPSTFTRLRDIEVYYQSADCTGERLYTWGPPEECRDVFPEPTGMTVEPFKGQCAVHAITDTLEFEGPPSTRSTLFSINPVNGCRALFDPTDRVKILKATKVVDPAERFIAFERELSE